jgi:5-methyltetrahydropteroyltriglutamate--homocysteine methyltransferase
LTLFRVSTNFLAVSRAGSEGSSMSSISPGLYLSSTGSYPRVGDAPELQLLQRTIAALDLGERTTADVLDAQNTVTRGAIADQVKAGLDIVTDGQIRWGDPISYVPSKLENVELQGSVPFFDTERFCRQPLFTGAPARRGSLVVAEYSFARNALGHLPTPANKAGKLAIKPVLTGPYTLAKFSLSGRSDNGGAGTPATLEARAIAYGEILAPEIEALSQCGAEMIQIDEPAILRNPGDWAILEKSLAPLFQARDKAKKTNRRLELALYVYFDDCAPLYEKLLELPVDILGVDFASSPKLAEMIVSIGSPKPLALGLLDGRSQQMEQPADVARQVQRMFPRIQGGRAYLGPSCGLEYLTSQAAFAKFALLPKVLAELNG